MTTPADACGSRGRDLACGRSAIALWCVPAIALLIPVASDLARAWIWTTALTVMGIACLVNVRRCGRLHCYITGPVFMVGAVLSLLRGLGRPWLSWDWTGGLVLVGWFIGHAAEWTVGRYAGDRRRKASP
jgi:hypothetical protein